MIVNYINYDYNHINDIEDNETAVRRSSDYSNMRIIIVCILCHNRTYTL